MKKLLGILLFISIALSANAQLLWKVSGKGLEKPSYIFGTYHLSPLSIKDSIAAMPQAMSETAQVYGEVVMSEMATPAFMQSMQQQMMMPKDTTLQSLFTPEQYEEVGKAIKENMMVDIAMLAQLKPAQGAGAEKAGGGKQRDRGHRAWHEHPPCGAAPAV